MDLDNINQGEWMIALNRYESLFNKRKEEFNGRVKLYYKQPMHAKVVTEEQLQEDIDELKRLKEEMESIRKHLIAVSDKRISNPNFILFRI